jgi:glycosyltransferase involved in cell wall biosynthesis
MATVDGLRSIATARDPDRLHRAAPDVIVTKIGFFVESDMMRDVPSISVVIPVRNRPEVIHRAIDSVQAQSVGASEVIVVDDGSTDETPETAEARSTTELPVRVVRGAQRGGAPRARNVGASRGQGALIAFLDSDDTWAPDKLEKQVELLRARPDMPAVFTNIQRIRDGVPAETTNVAPVVALADLFKENILGGCSTAMIRREAFEKIGGFHADLPSCQDWDLWLRLAELGPLGCCADPLTFYYFDATDRISRNADNVLNGHRIVMGGIYDRLNDAGQIDKLKRFHQLYMAEIASFSLYNSALGRSFAFKSMMRPLDARSFGRAAKLLALNLVRRQGAAGS